METLTNENVAALVCRARTGDDSAWESLVVAMSPLVWSVARGFGLAHHDAIDVSQTTWLQFARHLHRIEETEKVAGWLATTARRECQRLLRRNTREFPSPQDRFSQMYAEPEAPSLSERDLTRRVVLTAVNALPEPCKLLVRMFLADPPPSYQVVASTLGFSLNSIGPRRSRCLKQLRSSIEV